MGGAWASLMLANTSLALPVPAACILFIPQQRERWQSISEEQPFVIPTAAPFPLPATDTKIITIIRVVRLIDLLPCDRAAANLAIAWLLHLASLGLLTGKGAPEIGRLGSIHLAASPNNSLHSGLFSTSARRPDQDVDFPRAVPQAQR